MCTWQNLNEVIFLSYFMSNVQRVDLITVTRHVSTSGIYFNTHLVSKSKIWCQTKSQGPSGHIQIFQPCFVGPYSGHINVGARLMVFHQEHLTSIYLKGLHSRPQERGGK